MPASTAVEVFQRIRSMNASAGVVSCSRGNIDPAELEGLGAFDRLMRYDCVVVFSWVVGVVRSCLRCYNLFKETDLSPA